MIKGLIVLLLVMLITSCAYPTSYHRESRYLGYSDTKVSDNRYEVVFKANDYTNLERLNDFVLLRAAEITVNNGYSHFSLVSTQYSNELKKAPGFRAHSARLDYTPTVYIKNDNDFCEVIKLDETTKSELVTAKHNKTKTLRHSNFDSRIPDLQDINSPHNPEIENLKFSSTVNKSIIRLSNNGNSIEAKYYRAADIIKNITAKYNIAL